MLYGEKTRLRAIEREDIPAFLRWFNDPEVRQGLAMFGPMGKAAEESWVESLASRHDDFVFAVEASDVDPNGSQRWVHIGNVGLHSVDWRNRHCIFGIALGEKAYWGKGYGTDATRTILRFAFLELNLHRVELEVYAYNARAIRTYEKAGFRHEGTRRQSLFRDGRYHDAHIMAVLADDLLVDQAI